jgi:hypothetical protein
MLASGYVAADRRSYNYGRGRQLGWVSSRVVPGSFHDADHSVTLREVLRRIARGLRRGMNVVSRAGAIGAGLDYRGNEW